MSSLLGRVNMSPLTGLCLAAASAGLLAVLPGGLLIELLSGRDEGSRIARRVLPLALLGPVLIGLVRLAAQRRGLLSLEYGIATLVISAMVFFSAAIVWGALRANRAMADRRAELEVQTLLAEASALLGSSLDVKATLNAVASLCVPRFGDWCAITLINQYGIPESAAVAPAGHPEFDAAVLDRLSSHAAQRAGQDGALRALGVRSWISVPLTIGGGKVGAVLSLATTESGRLMDDRVRSVAHLLGERCASAIERAGLFDDLQQELRRREQAEASLRDLAEVLEQRVAQRTAELNAANRELESFAYSVSHDLRTPLRALDGFSQALLEDYADRLDDDGRDYLRRIRRGSQRMGELIDALLELSRVSRVDLNREPVDLSAIAADILESLRERSGERVVETLVQPDVVVSGDPRLLRALIQNLLVNAWKFTSRTPDARIEFAMSEGNGRPRSVVVRDNGAGFDMAYVSKLFGAFQRLHRDSDFEGTGVGLATAQRIVHRHGGEIWAEGAPGKGASFSFTLGGDS